MNFRLSRLLLLCISLLMSTYVWSQKDYTVVLPKESPLIEGHLKQGSHLSPSGHSFSLNNLYYLKDGQPWYPVMGEIHYGRVPRADWEESILKMKVSGVTVIATYVFWNYHEEKENTYTWEGNKDLRHFLELCHQHGMYVWLRIGPWCHGEVRYGGFPDWLMGIEGGVRKDNPVYLKHVERFFNEIGKQAEGMYFKNEGPVIGLQIENEYRFDSRTRLNHMLNLKRIAIQSGMDVPYYTATGWPKSDLKQTELIPVWGGYPEAPWSSKVTELALSRNYLFSSWASDPAVGADLLGEQENTTSKGLQYPYSTAEMGGGNQITYHRRPVIAAKDVVAQSYVKVGSGANMMGYYMYHGGSNPIGKYSTLQESKATKYPNDYPIINYDFNAPIGEWGQLNESYYDLKTLHAFLNDFGPHLATTVTTFPDKRPLKPGDNGTLRMSVRSHGNSGYVFINNYQRLLEMKDLSDIRIRVQQQGGTELLFPPMNIASGEQLIMPFNIDINGHLLHYATVQPLYILKNKVPTYVFLSHPGTASELVFSAGQLKKVMMDGRPVKNTGDKYLLKCGQEKEHLIVLSAVNGRQTKILLLTQEQARRSWKIQKGNEDLLCITSSQVIPSSEEITVRNVDRNQFEMQIYPADSRWKVREGISVKKRKLGEFQVIRFEVPAVPLQVSCRKEQNPESYVPQQPVYPEDNRLKETPESCPGPQYFVNFKPVPSSLYYAVSVPQLPASVKNAYLIIDYTGDTGALYSKGALIADDYYWGGPMMFDAGRMKRQGSQEYLLQIIPFAPEVNIYLDPSVRKKLELSSQGVRSIRIAPVYDVKFDITK